MLRPEMHNTTLECYTSGIFILSHTLVDNF